MSSNKNPLTDKEKLIVAISDLAEMVVCENTQRKFIEKYPPDGLPSGIIYSKSYKPIIKKSLFSKTKYYLLTMHCGETEIDGYLGNVSTWCEYVCQFKDKAGFYNYLDRINLYIERAGHVRDIVEDVSFI
jgi:hypothetical protein